MKRRNGAQIKWMVLGGHRVRVRIPPDKPLEERIKGLEKLAWEMRKIARERILKKTH